MAVETGTYTDVNNALQKVNDWAFDEGWTIEDFSDDATAYQGTFTGKRLHISKSIGGTTRYFNFRSSVAQKCFSRTSYGVVTGINLNGSTAYSGGTYWDKQTLYTSQSYTLPAGDSTGGCVDLMDNTSGGNYWFFSQPSSLTCVFDTLNTYSDRRMFTIGVVGGYPFYAASGGYYDSVVSTKDSRSGFMAASASISQTGAWSFYDGTGWLTSTQYPVLSTGRAIPPIVDGGTPIDSAMPGISASIIKHSPDLFRGNTLLAPSMIMAIKGTANELYPVGEIDGIKFVNMKNYSDEQTITYEGDTYTLFRIRKYPDVDTGVAIKQ